MRTKFLLAIIAGLWAIIFTHSVRGETLTIVVNNVNSGTGSIMLQVLAGEAQFKGKSEPILQTQRAAQPGSITFTAPDLPPGDYAIRVMHDENGNGKLDSNFVGIPTEPWAMSNNAKGNFGPPKWGDAMFTLTGDTTHAIDLN